MPVYFDTNIVRYLRNGLACKALSDKDKAQVELSPLTVLELVSQIATASEEALGAIHSMRSWIDTGAATLLGWSETFLAHWVFGKEAPDEISEGLAKVLRTCYESERADDKLKDDAKALSDFLEESKCRKATLLRNAVSEIRGTIQTDEERRAGTILAIADGLRSQIGSKDCSDEALKERLPAYFEFHTHLIERAVQNEDFNFFTRKHLNDHFDAEQLTYLADPSLHFFTTDGGYRPSAVVDPRIHVLAAGQMQDPAKALSALTAEIGRVAQD